MKYNSSICIQNNCDNNQIIIGAEMPMALASSLDLRIVCAKFN